MTAGYYWHSDLTRGKILGRLGVMKKGFTLVELLVVITIISVLTAIVVITYSRVQGQARDVKRKEELRGIQTVLQGYYNEKTAYPLMPSPSPVSSALYVLVPNYTSSLPVGPRGTKGINTDYMYVSDGASYGLCVQLEVPTMPGSMWKLDLFHGSGREVVNTDCTVQ